YRVPLTAYQELKSPVTIEQIDVHKTQLKQLTEKLKSYHGSIYFPWELSDKRPSRPLQGYAFKLPAGVVELFPSLTGETEDGPTFDNLSFDRRTIAQIKQFDEYGRVKKRPKGQKHPKRSTVAKSDIFARDPAVK